MIPAAYLEETRRLLTLLKWDEIDYVLQELRQLQARGGRLFLVGNGGGAGIASHAASDFRKFAGLEAWAFDNMPELTARINDDGWTTTVADWLEAARYGANDLLFVFSVGGGNERTSSNLAHAIRVPVYNKNGGRVVGICGEAGGDLKKYANATIVVPTGDTFQVESVQGVLAHLLVACT